MPYLIVLGGGSWWASNGVRYPEGVHEVTTEIAQSAQQSGLRSLVVSDTMPTVVQNVSAGPLSMDDLRFGVREGVKIVGFEEQEPVDDDEPYAIPLDYTCDFCPKKFPSTGSRDRHVEFHHTAQAARIQEEAAPVQPGPEPLPDGVSPDDPGLRPDERR